MPNQLLNTPPTPTGPSAPSPHQQPNNQISRSLPPQHPHRTFLPNGRRRLSTFSAGRTTNSKIRHHRTPTSPASSSLHQPDTRQLPKRRPSLFHRGTSAIKKVVSSTLLSKKYTMQPNKDDRPDDDADTNGDGGDGGDGGDDVGVDHHTEGGGSNSNNIVAVGNQSATTKTTTEIGDKNTKASTTVKQARSKLQQSFLRSFAPPSSSASTDKKIVLPDVQTPAPDNSFIRRFSGMVAEPRKLLSTSTGASTAGASSSSSRSEVQREDHGLMKRRISSTKQLSSSASASASASGITTQLARRASLSSFSFIGTCSSTIDDGDLATTKNVRKSIDSSVINHNSSEISKSNGSITGRREITHNKKIMKTNQQPGRSAPNLIPTPTSNTTTTNTNCTQVNDNSDDGSSNLTRVSRTGFMERGVAGSMLSAARGNVRRNRTFTSTKPAHHAIHGGFTNPWPSYLKDTSHTLHHQQTQTFFHKVAKDRRVPDEELASLLLLATKPNFQHTEQKDKFALSTIWLGHCTTLMTLHGGFTILTDPVWNGRLGPLGPKRLVPPVCAVKDLPNTIDLVILTSACYDHFDKNAITSLGDSVTLWCVPLGIKPLLTGLGIDKDRIVQLDWWQQHTTNNNDNSVNVICTPSQHHSVREGTLWCSWVILTPNHRIFYCGGTGYRSVDPTTPSQSTPQLTLTETYDHRVRFGGPYCPAFKHIGRKYGPFDTAFLPIGGSKPRVVMSGVQGDAIDMLFIHKDIQARRSVALRWGTYQSSAGSSDEGLLDAVRCLEFALQTGPVSEQHFAYVKHGRLHVT